jgi:hypothetical protein
MNAIKSRVNAYKLIIMSKRNVADAYPLSVTYNAEIEIKSLINKYPQDADTIRAAEMELAQ